MSDGGYTLVETLAAMLIIGLAISGLTLGVQVMSQQQIRTNALAEDAEALRAGRTALERVLQLGGPFRSHEPEAFTGDASAFRLACGRPEPCSAALVVSRGAPALRIDAGERPQLIRLPLEGPLAFRYRGAFDPGPSWPQPRPERQALRTVSIVSAQDAARPAYVTTRAWTEQPADCQFDAILEDCR